MDFPRFQELPLELRLKIWHLAVTPRLVHYPRRIEISGWSSRNRTKVFTRYHQSYPPLLHVNREARDELSATYPIRFQRGIQGTSTRMSGVYGVPFNAALDTLLVDVNWVSLARSYPEDLEPVKFVALRGDYYHDLDRMRNVAHLFRPLANLFSSCPSVERAYYCLPNVPSKHSVKETSTAITSPYRVGDLPCHVRAIPAQGYTVDEAYVSLIRRDLHEVYDCLNMPILPRRHFSKFNTEEERELEYSREEQRWNDCARVVCLSDLEKERHILGTHDYVFEPLR